MFRLKIFRPGPNFSAGAPCAPTQTAFGSKQTAFRSDLGNKLQWPRSQQTAFILPMASASKKDRQDTDKADITDIWTYFPGKL